MANSWQFAFKKNKRGPAGVSLSCISVVASRQKRVSRYALFVTFGKNMNFHELSINN